MRQRFFGPPWDAGPLLAHAEPHPTPVGQRCDLCQEPIRDGDRGIWQVVIKTGFRSTTGRHAPVHAECQLLDAVGCQFGFCVCGTSTVNRRDAKALWRHVQAWQLTQNQQRRTN